MRSREKEKCGRSAAGAPAQLACGAAVTVGKRAVGLPDGFDNDNTSWSSHKNIREHPPVDGGAAVRQFSDSWAAALSGRKVLALVIAQSFGSQVMSIDREHTAPAHTVQSPTPRVLRVRRP
ncbi:unnamed protein product [Spodoptera exigua]|nr:unnamed protein product [Spodoptera exigua]